MTRRERARTLAKVEEVHSIVRKYGEPDTPPLYLPPAPPEIDALIERLTRLD